MKRALFLFLLLPFHAICNNKADFVVESKNGYRCIIHITEKGESLASVALSFSVKPSVLANVNNLSSTSDLKINQPIIIPLLETNYYKTAGISSGQKGFYPLYYMTSGQDNIQAVCENFVLQQSAFLKWNNLQSGDNLQNHPKVIIGWIKYSTANGQVPASRVQEGSPVPSQKAVIKPSTGSEKVVPQNRPIVKSLPVSAPKPIVKSEPQNVEKKKEVLSEPSHIYQENEKRGLGSKLTVFFRKIKQKLNRKDRNSEEDNPVAVVKSDKINSPVSNNASTKKRNEGSEHTSNKTITEHHTPVKKKKSIKEIWSNLVNGKNYTPPAKPSRTAVNNTVGANQKNTVQKNNTNSTVVKKYTDPKPPKTNIIQPVKKSTPLVSESAANKTTVSKTKVTPVATPSPVVKSTTASRANVTKPLTSDSIKKNIPVEKPYIVKPNPEKGVRGLTTTKSESDKMDKVQQPEKKKEAIVVRKDDDEDVKAIDNTIRSEVKSLSLNKSKAGKCAYFFSGPVSGHFYVFTNLANKGEIVKITNTQNSHSVMAEVIGSLPIADVNKGLMIKLSDNAKLPLGQKNTSFTVKVNY